MTTGERIRQLRTEKGLTQEELGRQIGVKKSAVYKYENGLVVNLKRDVLETLAEIFQVSPAYLLGLEDEPVPAPNLRPAEPPGTIPLLGSIACGSPLLAEQNIEDYVDLPAHIRADFALTCRGDSMIRAGIQDGDIVYIRQQPQVENGQIAAVMVDGSEATLKRFYRTGDVVTLVAENPSVQPFVFTGSEISRLRVAGLAVAYTHSLL